MRNSITLLCIVGLFTLLTGCSTQPTPHATTLSKAAPYSLEALALRYEKQEK